MLRRFLEEPERYRCLFQILENTLNRLPQSLLYPSVTSIVRKLLWLEDHGCDLEKLLRLQLAKLLRHALTTVPYYRENYPACYTRELSHDTSFDILCQLPLLSKSQVMENPEAFISDTYRNSMLFSRTSSGSTGRAIKMYKNLAEYFVERNFLHWYWGRIGFRPTARILRIRADAIRSDPNDACWRRGNNLMISPAHFNEDHIGHILESIDAFRPEYIYSYPSCFEYLLRHLSHGSEWLNGLRGVMLASEKADPEVFELASEHLPGVAVLIHYGLSERTNLALGMFDNGRLLYSTVRSYGFWENLPSEDEYCEIVGTSYWNRVMPLLRYRTQDYGTPCDGNLIDIVGRSQEFLITRAGKRIIAPHAISIGINKFVWDYVDGLQIVQNVPGHIVLAISPGENYSEAIEDKIVDAFRSPWEHLFDVSVSVNSMQARTGRGKMRFVVSNIA